ncbi:hypothetical protein BSF38_03269 [Paludisphaera borealis]|uniref:Uncharacterized protein n=1 Tax=Paludisphaera borealis TaxID=1387353 RepID=A0A1U7CS31_9BACT|nr:hypothetical protein BSF38_03269 [Paludisphaera borealis]
MSPPRHDGLYSAPADRSRSAIGHPQGAPLRQTTDRNFRQPEAPASESIRFEWPTGNALAGASGLYPDLDPRTPMFTTASRAVSPASETDLGETARRASSTGRRMSYPYCGGSAAGGSLARRLQGSSDTRKPRERTQFRPGGSRGRDRATRENRANGPNFGPAGRAGEKGVERVRRTARTNPIPGSGQPAPTYYRNSACVVSSAIVPGTFGANGPNRPEGRAGVDRRLRWRRRGRIPRERTQFRGTVGTSWTIAAGANSARTDPISGEGSADDRGGRGGGPLEGIGRCSYNRGWRKRRGARAAGS